MAAQDTPTLSGLSDAELQNLARRLDDARLEAREIERLTAEFPHLSLPDAYRIQELGIELRLARGERYCGMKMGLTSEAKRRQMNLDSPCYGVLTREMMIEPGARYSLKGGIHPKIEPEIAFLTGRELRGRITREEALSAVTAISSAMEILDSRYTGFKYFSLPDVVADNSSSYRFLLGRTIAKPGEVDLANLRMVMEVDGEIAQEGVSSAISGDPIVSLVQLCELLDARGKALPAGSIVLAGAATPAVELKPGLKVRLTVDGLGSLELDVSE